MLVGKGFPNKISLNVDMITSSKKNALLGIEKNLAAGLYSLFENLIKEFAPEFWLASL
jgi:hypothetical protein